MAKKYKQYVATCEDECITTCGTAETPDLAFDEFMSSGEFNEYCAINYIPAGEVVDVTVSGILSFDEADEDQQEFMEHEGWTWITDGPSETRKATAPASEE